MPNFINVFLIKTLIGISLCTFIFYFTIYRSIEIDLIKFRNMYPYFLKNSIQTRQKANFDQNFDDSYSSNFHLWSRDANKVNWSDPLRMCRTILSITPANQSDKKYNALFSIAKNWKIPKAHNDESIFNLLSNCTRFRRLIHFPTEPASKLESEFPLAYVLLGARNAAQTLRLFRNIYQPQNAYCFTYDTKSSKFYQNSIKRLVDCFSNDSVFLTPKPEPVDYMMYSILHSVTNCIEVLYKQKTIIPWRYIQIVSWNDFPLKTNLDAVKIFEILNGSQDSALNPLLPEFIIPRYQSKDVTKSQKRPIVPGGLTMYKGSFATSMSRKFIEFLFNDEISQKLYQYLNDTKCAEEHYWTTLVHNLYLNAPGQFPGQCLTFYEYHKLVKPFISRYQIWMYKYWHEVNCQGKFYFISCVYGAGDIPVLIRRPELIAHKIYEEFEPFGAFCLEYWHWMKIRNFTDFSFDASYYANLPSVRYHNSVNKEDFIC